MTPRIYITTSIPYVNAPPHLGHALELGRGTARRAPTVARIKRPPS